MAWESVRKEDAVKFCESLNLSLPDRKIYLLGKPKGFLGRGLWLSTEFSFPEISVDEESPIKEDVRKILTSFQNEKTAVHVMK